MKTYKSSISKATIKLNDMNINFDRTSYWTLTGKMEATGFRLTKRRPGMYFLYQTHGNKFIGSIKEYLDINAAEEALKIIRGIVRYNG